MWRAVNGIESYESLAVLKETLQESPDFHSFTQTGEPGGFLGQNSSVASSLCKKMFTALLGTGENG